MIPDIPEASADGKPLTTDQRKCMKGLVEQLREITLKIEELDAQEERIQGDSSANRDQLRAINITRIVHVNQQKDLEKQLDDVLNACPPEPEPEPVVESQEIHVELDPVSTSQKEAHVELTPVQKPESEPKRIPQIRRVPPHKEEEKKSRFKFNVLSFKICPVCDARVPANFRTCGRCATKLDNFCPHCASAVPHGVTFCGRCGKKID